MDKECAFCPEIANKSGEHIWSTWMNVFSPGKKRFIRRDATGRVISDWICGVFNWKAYVVCEKCNNGWMSDIEKWHAKPAMSDLIADKPNIPVPQLQANSIALFAFKTAVILDYMALDREPFFDRTARHNFRSSHTIPDNVMMFIFRLSYKGRGDARSGYFDGAISSTQHLKTFVSTFAVGHFGFEVVGYHTRGITRVAPRRKDFDSLAVPFWPVISSGFIWPRASALRTIHDFDSFSLRWRDVDVRLL
jgi:hypothetical protein